MVSHSTTVGTYDIYRPRPLINSKGKATIHLREHMGRWTTINRVLDHVGTANILVIAVRQAIMIYVQAWFQLLFFHRFRLFGTVVPGFSGSVRPALAVSGDCWRYSRVDRYVDLGKRRILPALRYCGAPSPHAKGLAQNMFQGDMHAWVVC